MSNDQLKEYVNQKLSDLNKEKDMMEVTGKGKLSFGIHSKEFSHLPSWNILVKNKKKLVSLFWSGGFILSFLIVGATGNIWDKLEQNWLKAIVNWVLTSAFIMFFYVLWFYFSLFVQIRQTERQIRKLIYEDILDQLQKTARAD